MFYYTANTEVMTIDCHRLVLGFRDNERYTLDHTGTSYFQFPLPRSMIEIVIVASKDIIT